MPNLTDDQYRAAARARLQPDDGVAANAKVDRVDDEGAYVWALIWVDDGWVKEVAAEQAAKGEGKGA